ncbi:uncharacterized protein AMSG_04426 [Thecamonas trahens ATCC 50062]|uniref:Uncharacterized protein n=1 Tax=Thecamonas trahens ATCC 50062 TaxID=461836 RepID=A0A0L0D742_THETB|nr:hypothetical protein AMSG_04426 [Thecamonas trahens ATCC 50062]KNC48197.1 hypothetical protein AMSG_04426 [Thecamonas trahens ATCC 50062]|eukprot:XP_013758766.1 hypothetical protein AMSG_04426 [Thecamonas trahens ATCC 50062]
MRPARPARPRPAAAVGSTLAGRALTFMLRHMVWILFICIGGTIVLTMQYTGAPTGDAGEPPPAAAAGSAGRDATAAGTAVSSDGGDVADGGLSAVWGYMGMATVCIGGCLFTATKVSKALAKMDLQSDAHTV